MGKNNVTFTLVVNTVLQRKVLKMCTDSKGKVKLSLDKCKVEFSLDYLYDFVQSSLMNLDTKKVSEGLKRRRRTLEKGEVNDC